MISVVVEVQQNLEKALCAGQGKDGQRHCSLRGVVVLERKSTGVRHNALAKSYQVSPSEL